MLGFSLVASGSATVIACGSGTSTSIAQGEKNQVNGKTVNLNDTSKSKYEGETVKVAAHAIDAAMENQMHMTDKQAQDFSFNDPTKSLKTGPNTVGFTVKNPTDKSTATGSFTVNVQYPATKIVPATKMTTAQQEAAKVDGQTITLNDTSKNAYEGKTAQTDVAAIDSALVPTYVKSAKDFSFDNTKKLALGDNENVGFSVKATDGTTAKGTFNVKIAAQPKPTPGKVMQMGVIKDAKKATTAQKEADKVQGKTVNLKDVKIAGYKVYGFEGKTAAQDAWIIKSTLIKEGVINNVEANDFSFDNTTKLKAADNENIGYSVKAPDGTTAKGTINIDITPHIESAQSEAAKANGKTINLNDFGVWGHQIASYEGKTAAQDAWIIKGTLIQQKIINNVEANDFSFDNTTPLKVGANKVNYTVKTADGSTATGTLNVNIANKATTEAAKVQGKTVTLKDLSLLGYKLYGFENKTAAQDAWMIKATLIKEGVITSTEANDFTFDNTTKLKAADNKNIGYTVKGPDGSIAKGTINIDITPHIESAQSEAAKAQGKKVDLQDLKVLGFTLYGFENKTAAQDSWMIKAQLIKDKILSNVEVNDFTFDNTTKLKVGDNRVKYTVKAQDGTTATGTLDVDII